MSNSVLETQQLSKSFKGITSSDQATPVIKNLNLHIKAGETLAVVGASGAGKSTLLHVLGGLDQADSGRVLWNGNNIADWSVKKLGQQRNKTLGFIYQFHHLLPEFNALDNVAMTMRIGGHSKTESQQKAAEVLERMGLAHRLKHRPAELSGGERQRVAIARALVNNPQAILADEPTGNLDHQTANHVFEQLLQTTRDQNTALVIVTHSTELAKRCAQVMHLEKGRLQLSSFEPSPA